MKCNDLPAALERPESFAHINRKHTVSILLISPSITGLLARYHSFTERTYKGIGPIEPQYPLTHSLTPFLLCSRHSISVLACLLISKRPAPLPGQILHGMGRFHGQKTVPSAMAGAGGGDRGRGIGVGRGLERCKARQKASR